MYPTDPQPHGIVSGVRLVIWQITRAGLTLALAVETGQLRGHVLTQNLIAVGFR